MAEKRYMVTPLFWLQAEKKSKAVSMLGKNRVFDFEGKNPPFFGAGISKKKSPLQEPYLWRTQHRLFSKI
ncbi:MAG: hypothetical protein IIC13_01470 [SAR324 cluster bacterium]|nr:hypothetical protein [SAR324 cluster bacterium]MCH8885234.1 hypothetical protein [SAR324 cluster bacterium]